MQSSLNIWLNMIWKHVIALCCNLICKVMWQQANFFNIQIQRSWIIPNRFRAKYNNGISSKTIKVEKFHEWKMRFSRFFREKGSLESWVLLLIHGLAIGEQDKGRTKHALACGTSILSLVCPQDIVHFTWSSKNAAKYGLETSHFHP